jgi:hypothetical protein
MLYALGREPQGDQSKESSAPEEMHLTGYKKGRKPVVSSTHVLTQLALALTFAPSILLDRHVRHTASMVTCPRYQKY